MAAERLDVEEPQDEALAVPALAPVDELVGVAPAPARRRVDRQVLEVDQAREVHLELGVAPGDRLADLPTGEAHLLALDPELLAPGGDVAVQEIEQPPGLGRQLVEGCAEDLGRQAVGGLDVGKLHLDVAETALCSTRSGRVALHLPLVLVDQGDGVDQRQVLLVVPPRPRAGVEEGQVLGVGVDDGEGAQQPLGVAVPADHLLLLPPRDQALERPALPLDPVDRPGLLPALGDRKHQAPVQKLLVDVRRRGGQKDRHRPLDPVLVGHQPPGGRVLAGRGDGQLTFGLEELQGVGGPLGTLLFGDGEYLVGQIGLPHVEEALAGHRRVGHPLLGRHQLENRIEQRGLARGRGGLDDHRQRLGELAARRGEIPGEGVDLLADHAGAVEVGDDALQELRVPEQLERLALLFGRERRRRLALRLERAADRHVLEDLQLAVELGEVGLDHRLLDLQLERRLLDEGPPLLGRHQVDRVDEEDVAPGHPHQHLQALVGEVLLPAPHPVAPVAEDAFYGSPRLRQLRRRRLLERQRRRRLGWLGWRGRRSRSGRFRRRGWRLFPLPPGG